jgi:uncharacterized protein YbjQ (UPF0145 family)
MIVTIAPSGKGRSIRACHGIAAGEAIRGAGILRGLLASETGTHGGRSAACEGKPAKTRGGVRDEIGARTRAREANGVVGMDLLREAIAGMPMVPASGTSVRVPG